MQTHTRIFFLSLSTCLICCTSHSREMEKNFHVENEELHADDFLRFPTTLEYTSYVVKGERAITFHAREEYSLEAGAIKQTRCPGKGIKEVDKAKEREQWELVLTAYHCMGSLGFAEYAVETSEKREEYEPYVRLPATFNLGFSWSGTHESGLDWRHRECSIEATPYCTDGVAVTCVSQQPQQSRISWLRQHYCRADGWRGNEHISWVNGAETYRSWSGQVTKDGQPLQELPLEQRPFPRLNDLAI